MASELVKRRVFVPHALGADEFLRVTWHDTRRVAVFSIWSGAECTAAVPVRVAELTEVAELLERALGDPRRDAWPAPDPDALVVPATGFRLPTARSA